jgi:hypothetical protein
MTIIYLVVKRIVWVTAEQEPVILELLEIPQLMNTCVRNGSYDEALDLRAFAAKVALLHPNIEARLFCHHPSSQVSTQAQIPDVTATCQAQ